MQKGLVSILTPCYNTGGIVHRLMDSILMQNYPWIEMFVVDDGSNDNTEEVIKSYIPVFEARGYHLTYIFQENGGQSSAIDNGLKFVDGEFLIWPDSDDFFKMKDAVSKFVDALDNAGEGYGVVRCIPTYVDENMLTETHRLNIIPEYKAENQFCNCLYSTDFFWGAGDYMVRMDAFDMVNPNRSIYVEKTAGQNWQMLMPILYSYKCITLKESLFCVLERSSSHCRGLYQSYEDQMKVISCHKDTILHTLDAIIAMPEAERTEYVRNIVKKYKIEELELSISFGRYDDMRLFLSEMKSEDITIPYRRLYHLYMKRMVKNICKRFYDFCI